VCEGDNSTCTDDCGVVNGDNSSCTDCNGVVHGTSENDACGVCEGDNSTCTDDCGVVNGDSSTCTSQKAQVEMNLNVVVQDVTDQVEMNAIQSTLEESMEESLDTWRGSVSTISLEPTTRRRYRSLSSSEKFVWKFEVTYTSSETQDQLTGMFDESTSNVLDDFTANFVTNANSNPDMEPQDLTSVQNSLDVTDVSFEGDGDDGFPDYGIALVVIGGVAALAGVAGIVVSMGLCCSSDNTNAQVVQNTGMEMSDKA